MHTIVIQNCSFDKDKKFKLFVNDEKLVVRNMLYNTKVDDDTPFRIRAKYFWNGSPEYSFEPKNNMILQILTNRKVAKWQQMLTSFALIFILVQILYIKGNNFLFYTGLLFLTIPFFIIRNKMLFIREVKPQSTNDVN